MLGKSGLNRELEIAGLLYQRKSYNAIAKALKVSPKTISLVKRKVEDGIIVIGADGKAEYVKGKVAMGMEPKFTLSNDQIIRIYGLAHLEGMSPGKVVDTLLNEDHMIRKRLGLSFKEVKMLSDFLNDAVDRGWRVKSDPNILGAVTKFYNLGLLYFPPETLKQLIEVVEWAVKRCWNAFDFAEYVMRHHNELMIYMRYVKGEISYEEFKRSVEPYVQN